MKAISASFPHLMHEDRRFEPPADLSADANSSGEAHARIDSSRGAFSATATDRGLIRGKDSSAPAVTSGRLKPRLGVPRSHGHADRPAHPFQTAP